MGTKVFPAFLCPLLLGFAGCEKAADKTSPRSQAIASPTSAPSTHQAKFDSCGLIKKEEIEAIQGSPVTDTKGTENSGKGFLVSQCYYSTKDSSRSVSLAVTQRDPGSSVKASPKDLWQKSFGRYDDETKEHERDKEKTEKQGTREEREKSVPPKKINGIGDDAFWSANRFGGALYVLKKNSFIRISVGGPENEETQINKSKALAQKALDRL